MRLPVLCLLLAACAAPAPAPAPVPAPAPAPVSVPRNPVTARFVDLPASYTFRACETLLFTVVRGNAAALAESLRDGDVLIAQGSGDVAITGAGRGVLVTVQPPNCEPQGGKKIDKTVVRASAAPELTWAGGAMHANLDVDTATSPNAYLGRLRGSAPVAEHAHAESWEILCAIEAAGAFTLSGKEQRLAAGECVAVPPGEKHTWQPEPGSQLRAVQLYAPPGPEQRFRALAAGDAGAK